MVANIFLSISSCREIYQRTLGLRKIWQEWYSAWITLCSEERSSSWHMIIKNSPCLSITTQITIPRRIGNHRIQSVSKHSRKLTSIHSLHCKVLLWIYYIIILIQETMKTLEIMMPDIFETPCAATCAILNYIQVQQQT